MAPSATNLSFRNDLSGLIDCAFRGRFAAKERLAVRHHPEMLLQSLATLIRSGGIFQDIHEVGLTKNESKN